jgi:hypothetical protein
MCTPGGERARGPGCPSLRLALVSALPLPFAGIFALLLLDLPIGPTSRRLDRPRELAALPLPVVAHDQVRVRMVGVSVRPRRPFQRSPQWSLTSARHPT